MGKPKPFRSAMDAPIEIRATRPGSAQIATRVYPDEVDATSKRLADQGYTVVSTTTSGKDICDA